VRLRGKAPQRRRERESLSDGPSDSLATARERLVRLARRARWTLAFERLWPPLAAVLTLGLIFLAVSWFGLWFALPPIGRIVGVALFAAPLLGALGALARALFRAREGEAFTRLDRDSGAPHRPASSSLDRIADPDADEITRALWRMHQRQLARKVSRIVLAPPAPRMVERDRLALRLGALVLAIAAGFTAGQEKYARVAAAFDWRLTAANAASFRLDAWIDPPVYTGKPPIMLDALGKTAPANGEPVKVEAPVGSTLVLRADDAVVATIEGALAPVEAAKAAKEDMAGDKSAAPRAEAADPRERRWTIKGAGKLAVARNGSALSAFDILAVSAGKPKIALTAPAKRNARGSLTLRYRTSDQYGIAAAEADFAKPAGEAKTPPSRSLVEPPRMALELPPSETGTGEAQTTSDLSEHPWAGAKVTMTLRAQDVAGEEGTSEPVEITLPQRSFANPLARALVEERRDLVLDPDRNRPRVMTALDALLIAPDLFAERSSIYLGLTTAKTRLNNARADADLIAVADFLWSMALQIEDGDASQAERDLRAAEQRLREALERGASDEEIRELMKELRAAAENFARELAQNAQGQQGEDQDSDAATLDQQDLQNMLDRMEDSARSGDRAQAQAMLDQLQNLFENLRGAKRGRASQAQREMRRQLGELDRLLRDQQKLRDKTFRRDRRERMSRSTPDWLGRPSPSPDEDNPRMNKDGENSFNPFANNGDEDSDADQTPLDEQQRALRDRLAELQRKLKGLGAKGEKGFDDADGAMGEAERDLQQGDAGKDGKDGAQGGRGRTGKGDAVEAQGRALEALREGAEGLQRQMKGQGQGEGEGETAVEPGEGRHGRDPLDRDFGDVGRGMSTGPLGDAIGAAERARRVMEELRRRLSDPNRLEEERDYLERLLNRNLPD
jgi:uncharacterized protein (TIGR02302 family)